VVSQVVGGWKVQWRDITDVRVETVTLGFRRVPTVIVVSGNGERRPLSLWNQQSFVMLGARGGVDALAERIKQARSR
jgi:hypothetical protein